MPRTRHGQLGRARDKHASVGVFADLEDVAVRTQRRVAAGGLAARDGRAEESEALVRVGAAAPSPPSCPSSSASSVSVLASVVLLCARSAALSGGSVVDTSADGGNVSVWGRGIRPHSPAPAARSAGASPPH